MPGLGLKSNPSRVAPAPVKPPSRKATPPSSRPSSSKSSRPSSAANQKPNSPPKSPAKKKATKSKAPEKAVAKRGSATEEGSESPSDHDAAESAESAGGATLKRSSAEGGALATSTASAGEGSPTAPTAAEAAAPTGAAAAPATPPTNERKCHRISWDASSPGGQPLDLTGARDGTTKLTLQLKGGVTLPLSLQLPGAAWRWPRPWYYSRREKMPDWNRRRSVRLFAIDRPTRSTGLTPPRPGADDE